MKILLFAAAGLLAAQQPSIRLEPAVIASCQQGAGQATVFWDAQGVAPVTIFVAETPMSGPELTAGTALSGQWVAEGVVVSVRRGCRRPDTGFRASGSEVRRTRMVAIGDRQRVAFPPGFASGNGSAYGLARSAERADQWGGMVRFGSRSWTQYTPAG